MRRSACCTWPVARDYPELNACARREGYDLREYLDRDEFGDALAVADLVVARAGGSVFEIAASGTPAILVPYPHASADHQSANARWMADAGAAVVIADDELNARRLADEVAGLLADKAPFGGDGACLEAAGPARCRQGDRRRAVDGGTRVSARADRGTGGDCTSSAWAVPG